MPLWHPLGRGCQNGAPLFLRCFSTCFGSSGIYISSLLSEATEAMLLSFFWAPEKWHVSNVSFACRGDVQGVPKRHPFRLRGVVLAPLNACRQGVSTRESRVICVSEFPKMKVFVVQLVSNHLSQQWCYQHCYHHILLCFFGSAKGCRNVAP